MRNKSRVKWYFIGSMLLMYVIGSVVGTFTTYRVDRGTSYWASYQDGHRVRVKDLVVIPMMGPNDVNGIWPEYYAEREVGLSVVEGVKLVLQSRPFILSENPKVQGKFGERMVYFVPDQGR